MACNSLYVWDVGGFMVSRFFVLFGFLAVWFLGFLVSRFLGFLVLCFLDVLFLCYL